MTASTGTIVVILDGSERDTAVVQAAAHLSAADSRQVTLLRAERSVKSFPSDSPMDLLAATDRLERQADRVLQTQAQAFAGQALERVLLVGRQPEREIAGWLRRHPVDCVVVAAAESRGLRRFFARDLTQMIAQTGAAVYAIPARAGQLTGNTTVVPVAQVASA